LLSQTVVFLICFLDILHTQQQSLLEQMSQPKAQAPSVNVQRLPLSQSNSSQYVYNYTGKWTSLKNVTANMTVTTSYSIQRLETFTAYEIRKATVGGNQTGAYHGPVQVQTLSGVSLICYIMLLKFMISQSEAMSTVLISRYPAISNPSDLMWLPYHTWSNFGLALVF